MRNGLAMGLLPIQEASGTGSEMQKSKTNSAGRESRGRLRETVDKGAGAPNSASRPGGGSAPGSDLFIGLGLLATIVAIYWPVARFEFINYDDAEYVSENLRVQAGLTAENVAWAFRTTFFENWHPLTWLSYMLDRQLFGLTAGAFHLVNGLFHLLNSLLLFAVVKRMTGARWPRPKVAALFAVHPLHVESVAWVSERKDVLSAFFGMLTLWAYVRYAERPRIGQYLLAVLLFGLGLMAKPMLVTLPFVLLLLDFWPLRRLEFKAWQNPEALRGKTDEGQFSRVCPPKSVLGLVVEKIPFFVLTGASSVVTYMAQHGARSAAENLPLATRLANVLVAYVRYLGKAVWPNHLAAFYPYPDHWPVWQVAGSALVLLAVTFLVFRSLRVRPYLAVGWLWYIGTLVPVIGLVQVGGQSMADRYMYVPIIGLLVMFAWGAADLIGRWRVKKGGLMAAAVVLGCVVVSGRQVRFWQNSLVLFEHALAVAPGSALAHNNLGDALMSLGQTNEAVAHFSAALELDPKDFMAYGNLGNYFFGQGKIDEAAAKYQEGLRLNSRNPELNHNLGLCLAQQGKFSEAVRYYSTALQFRWEYTEALMNLGNALLALGKPDAAVTNYAAVLRLKSDSAPGHFNLANALFQQGKYPEAAAHYLQSIRLQPDFADAHSNLARALVAQGKNGDALGHLTEAVRLKPAAAEFHFHLGTVLESANRPTEAIVQYQEVLRLKPASAAALNNLAWLLATYEDAKVRNGAEAVRYAERACELTGRQQAMFMGTLAAAYAEAGRAADAVTAAAKAAELAGAAGQKELAATNQKLLELYRAGKTYRDAPKPPGKEVP